MHLINWSQVPTRSTMAVRYVGNDFLQWNRFATWLPYNVAIDLVAPNSNYNSWLAIEDLISIRKEEKDPKQNGDWMLELVKMVKDDIAEISKSGAV